ncbi:MAG: hypothetical protein ACOH2D_04375 [Gelidibacter sp.]
MININTNTKVFVYCPGDSVTGGAELLHQIVHYMNENKFQAYLVYFNSKRDFYDNETFEIPDDYLKYNINVASKIIDSEDNVSIIYEGIFDKAFTIKKSKLVLWWLSVDNFYYCSTNFLSLKDYYKWKPTFLFNVLAKQIYYFLIRRDKFSFSKKSLKDLKDLGVLNCYQSEYAQDFLKQKGFKKTLPLSDYINQDIVNSNDNGELKKEDRILYNPKKGLEYTKRLLQLAPELNWFPLEGMNRFQLIEKLRTSKVYIDFGYHPGKDRLPREAAICGCSIITNKSGSAKFYEDVSIPTQYKFENDTEPKIVIERIKYVLENFKEVDSDFDYYRNKIKKEESLFVDQIKTIFQYVD